MAVASSWFLGVMCGGVEKLEGKVVAFTTPAHYAPRLSRQLQLRGAEPRWCPSVVVESTDRTAKNMVDSIRGTNLESFAGIAFTSRAGILAMASALRELEGSQEVLLRENGHEFILGSLGSDTGLLQELGLFRGNPRVKLLSPRFPTPQALAESFGTHGGGRRIMCPVPLVEDLEEPPVVPEFLQALCAGGWDAVRVNAYITKWAGPTCARLFFGKNGGDEELPHALVFTSTAEVEGFIKGLQCMGISSIDELQYGKGCKMVVAAHGPVTARGAARLGVHVDVVSECPGSFAGVVDALSWHFHNHVQVQ